MKMNRLPLTVHPDGNSPWHVHWIHMHVSVFTRGPRPLIAFSDGFHQTLANELSRSNPWDSRTQTS